MRTPVYESGPGALAALLASSRTVARCSLYTIVLNGGEALRWTSADVPIILPDGRVFLRGPTIQDQGVRSRVGTEAGTLDVDLAALGDSGDAVPVGPSFDAAFSAAFSGFIQTPIVEFIENRGLDGATISVERLFRPSWTEPITGVLRVFAGRIDEIGDLTDSSATLRCVDWRILLNQNIPPDVYQSSCRHILGDQGCLVDLEAFRVLGHVVAPTPTASRFSTDVSAAAGVYNLGKLRFTSGANAGVVRTVRSQSGGGDLVFAAGFPVAPAVGDSFWVYPGCDLRLPTCTDKFNNRIHFGGQPFTPVPETPY